MSSPILKSNLRISSISIVICCIAILSSCNVNRHQVDASVSEPSGETPQRAGQYPVRFTVFVDGKRLTDGDVTVKWNNEPSEEEILVYGTFTQYFNVNEEVGKITVMYNQEVVARIKSSQSFGEYFSEEKVIVGKTKNDVPKNYVKAKLGRQGPQF